jgi:hypothetical protein
MMKFKDCGMLCLLLCSLFACNSTKSRPLEIDFAKDSASIEIRNIDPAGMAKIRNGELNDSLLQELVTVLQSPLAGDSVGMELEVEGKVLPAADALIFKPEAPFEKGRKYMVLTYVNSRFADFQSIIKSQTKFNMAPNQKVLWR